MCPPVKSTGIKQPAWFCILRANRVEYSAISALRIGAKTVGSRGNWSPTFRLGGPTMYWSPQLFGRSFQKARNVTASSHQNAGFSIWVFKNFPGVIPPDHYSGCWVREGGGNPSRTPSRTQHPARPVLGPKPWSPSTFQPWLRPWLCVITACH